MSKNSKRILPLLNDPRGCHRLVGEINLLDQNEPIQVGKLQEIKILKEIDKME